MKVTSNKTLNNWKREGLRVIRRRTEYVYTPVAKTPFSVAIASPNSFGRYYIDLPSAKESDYERQVKELMKNKYDSLIQLYNCSYAYTRLSEKILNPKQYTDYCIRYLFSDPDQVLAIKSDLVFHNIYYNLYNFSIFHLHPNLVKSSFYGTYSGITFYLPVRFYRAKSPSVVSPPPPVAATATANYNRAGAATSSTTGGTATSTLGKKKESSKRRMADAGEVPETTELPSEMTINVELASLIEPLFKVTLHHIHKFRKGILTHLCHLAC